MLFSNYESDKITGVGGKNKRNNSLTLIRLYAKNKAIKEVPMDNFLSAFCFLSLFFVIGLVGVYILLRSPALLKMNRERNSCTKETKFVWQKKYKSKTLCKLSEVKKAERSSGILSPLHVLYLKLRSGKDTAVFFAPQSSRGIDFTYDFVQMEDKINHFLNTNEKECIVKHSLVEFGVVCVGASFFASLFLIFVICYSG